ncbi:MAG: rhodanese-like domain-containing protein [Steroidobacteraceae bacterium]|jgi:rhodanese-related sulfurtransferase
MAATPQFDTSSPQSNSARVSLLSASTQNEETAAILERAHARARAAGLGYAGDVTPNEALELVSAGVARLIDVRTPEERKFVGYVPDSIAVPWATGTAFTRNPRFVRELEGKARKDEVLLLLCRSGARSVLAAEAATRAQFQHAFNVLEGFEGELDPQRRRGSNDGWRFHGLPWIQD